MPYQLLTFLLETQGIDFNFFVGSYQNYRNYTAVVTALWFKCQLALLFLIILVTKVIFQLPRNTAWWYLFSENHSDKLLKEHSSFCLLTCSSYDWKHKFHHPCYTFVQPLIKILIVIYILICQFCPQPLFFLEVENPS